MEQIRAMVVDDDPDLRDLLRLQLEMGGDIVVIDEASDAESAVDLTDRHHPDVIILDESMPGGRTGIEVIPDLVAASPGTVVIVYTANSGTDTREKVIEAGGHAVVGKSDSAALLVGTIHRLMPTAGAGDGPGPDQFGQRMTELLHRESETRPPRQTLRDRGIRPWFVVVALFLLPILIAAVWFVALALGLVDR
jgi:DNA-binding NarL/FixJ family response regulator